MALVTSPAKPAIGETVTVTVSGTANQLSAFEVSGVPTTSTVIKALITKPLDETDTRFDGTNLVGSAAATIAVEAEVSDNAIVFDKAGEYSITCYEFVEHLGIPSFDGDPRGVRRVVLASTATETVSVGTDMTLPLLGLTLKLRVVGSEISVVDLVNAVGDAERHAALASSVTTAINGILDEDVGDISHDLITSVNELRTAYVAHIADTSVHLDGQIDSTNVVTTSAATSTEGAIRLLNELLTVIVKHLRDATADGTPWHTVDDLRNLPIAPAAADLAAATVLASDLRYRCFARHLLESGDTVVAAQVWQHDLSLTLFVDETTDFNDVGAGDYLPFPATEGVGDYAAFGMATTFDRLRFNGATSGVAGVGGTVVWEYHNGITWAALTSVVDGTAGFTAAVSTERQMQWAIPTAWAKVSLNGEAALYYVRARLTGVYSTNPVYDQGFVGDELLVHDADDATNTLVAANKLDDVVIALFDELDDSALAATPTNESTGVFKAVQNLGFIVSDPT